MRRVGMLLAALLVAASAGSPAAGEGPQPPCGAAPAPDYPPPGAPPAIRLWRSGELGDGWSAPPCAAFAGGGFLQLVALAGRVDGARDLDAMLQRVGAVSTLAGVTYWSISDQRWQVLITRAAAIEDVASRRERPDFSAADLRSGRDLYFLQEENRLSAAMVYRLHVAAIAGERIVLTIENVSAAKRLFVPILRPGDLRSIYYFDRDADGGWKFYSLLRVGHGASILGWLVRQGSYLNRAVALYRHFAGIPTDAGPPAARE